ncbi:MAG: AAA family ATPase [Erysipelotrichales bacterium]|nr:AAA family ATPase [Erysipelotrichales bacterium]
MKIKKISITNFKSIYNTLELDFEKLGGLIKLSGPIGSGKSTISEAIRVGLYGNTKENNLPNYIAWNTDHFLIEINLESKGKDIYIRRHSKEQLQATIDGKELVAPNKKNMQEILEEFYDVPRMGVERMCVISFSQFNSIATMNPGQTKEFLDDVFAFKTFTNYNNIVVEERKIQIQEKTRLDAIISSLTKQIDSLIEKKEHQAKELQNNINIDNLNDERKKLIDKGIELKKKKDQFFSEYNIKATEYTKKMSEVALLGKQEKEYYEKYKSGVCPTCGQSIDMSKVADSKEKMEKYASEWKEANNYKKKLEESYKNNTKGIDEEISELKNKISIIDSKIAVYNNSLKIISENYDDMIDDLQKQLQEDSKNLLNINNDIGEWNDMNILFSKTLRYNLLENIIPNINKSIQYYIDKLEQPYRVEFDQEFKCHVYTDTNDKSINYKDLSTGQRKTLDICIIFGIIQNVIANVDFNIFFLDELFSNMDADSRNTMLAMLNENLVKEGRSVFVVNHAEMSDDFFNHKIRVRLENKKIVAAKRRKNDPEKIALCHSSHYDFIF